MDTVDSRLSELLDELSLEGDWTDRYRLLVSWGEDLDPLGEPECVAEAEVPGCSSPLWLKVWGEDGTVRVRGASPGILPKALVALVCRLFDGTPPYDGTVDGLLGPLDLKRNLSPTRYAVFETMVKRVLAGPGTSR